MILQETALTTNKEMARPDWVIADSRAALDYARRHNVPTDVPVLTASPALLADPTLRAAPIDGHLTADDMTAIHEATLSLALEIHEQLCGGPLEAAALTVARVPVRHQAALYRAMTLKEAHFSTPGVVAEIDAGSSALNARFSSPLSRILGGNTNVRVVTAPTSDMPTEYHAAPPVAGFFSRLKHATPESLLFRATAAIWQRLPFPGLRGDILILRENELLKEAALWLSLKGYGIRAAHAPKFERTPLSEKDGNLINTVLTPLFDKHVAPLLARSARAPTRDLFLDLSRNAYSDFIALLPGWRAALAGRQGARARAVLTNALATPLAESLYAACRERGLPMFMFQHGMTREICQRVASLQIFMENSGADYSVLFNAESARQEHLNPFGRGKPIVGGMPRDYYRATADRSKCRNAPPIWYVSLCLHLGNTSLLNIGVPDHLKADTEREILDLLAKLPHRVLYKPYPGGRYIDPDPVPAEAERHANTEVYYERIDLRYIAKAARVILTARAGGTFAWCFMQGKPVVFVNFPNQAPLRDEVRPLFEEAIFTFDAAEPDWKETLRAFLSQPIEAIEEQWAARADARRRFIKEYLDDAEGRGAGRRVARAISDIIRAGAKDD